MDDSSIDDDDLDDDDLDGPGARRRRRHLAPHRGGTVLTFGILGLVLCMPFGIAAWVMGNTDLREMREGRMDPAGESNTTAGRICGMISVLLAVVVVVVWLAIGTVFLTHSDEFKVPHR